MTREYRLHHETQGGKVIVELMTEADWLSLEDPIRMMAFVRESGRVSTRKARLAAACYRARWPELSDVRSRRAVEVAELYADGLADLEELSAACLEAGRMFGETRSVAADLACAITGQPD